MKKGVSLIVFIGVFLLITLNVSAAEQIEFSLRADESIKPGKDFNIFLSAKSNTDIGVFRICVEFDGNRLVPKSPELSNEYKGQYIKSEIYKDRMILIYMNSTEKSSSFLKDCIKFRFSLIDREDTGNAKYFFKTYLYESGDKNATEFKCCEMPVLSLNITQSGSSFEVSSEQIPEKYNSQNKASEESHIYNNSTDVSELQAVQNSLQYENHEYSISDSNSDITFKQDYFYFFAGAIILIVGIAVTAFKLGAKNKSADNVSKDKNN